MILAMSIPQAMIQADDMSLCVKSKQNDCRLLKYQVSQEGAHGAILE